MWLWHGMRHPQHGDFQSQFGMYTVTCTHVLKLGGGCRAVDPEPRRIENGTPGENRLGNQILCMYVSKILMSPDWHCSPLLILV